MQENYRTFCVATVSWLLFMPLFLARLKKSFSCKNEVAYHPGTKFNPNTHFRVASGAEIGKAKYGSSTR